MTPHFMLRHALIVALLAGNAGCDGSGGGVETGTLPPSESRALGSRGVPGGTVVVSTPAPIAPGVLNVFHLDLGNNLTPMRVIAGIGVGAPSPDEGSQATRVQTGAGTYSVSLPVPASISAESHVWVRLIFIDGSTIETGTDDFSIGGGYR